MLIIRFVNEILIVAFLTVLQEKGNYGDSSFSDSPRGRGVQFPFVVTDRVIIKVC